MPESIAQQISPVIWNPAALTDIFDANPTSPAVNMRKAREVSLILQTISAGVGLGKARVLAFCCDDAAKNNPVEIDYQYRVSLSGAAFGEVKKAEAGVSAGETARLETTTVNGALNDQYICTVRQRQCKENKPYVYFQLVETTNDPVVGRVVLLATEPVRIGVVPEDVTV